MHYKDMSGNDEMVLHFGFNEILSGEELSNNYLGGIDKIKDSGLTDHQSYRVLSNYLKNYSDKKIPFFIATYTIETHAWMDSNSKDGIKYKDEKNNVLNTIYNMDDAFGNFWKYFKTSKYAKNTIIIFTSDHAHFMGEKSYMGLIKKHKELDYQGLFIDRVPLLIYDPVTTLPNFLDANSSTSLNLAPSIAHLLNISQGKNDFLGTSLFVKNKSKNIGIAALGSNVFYIKNNRIHNENKLLKKFIEYTQKIELDNRLTK